MLFLQGMKIVRSLAVVVSKKRKEIIYYFFKIIIGYI